MPLPEARQVGTMMNPHLRVFDPHSGTTNVFGVNKGSLRRKETVIEDMTERPRPPVSHKISNTRSGRPKSPSSHQKSNHKPHHSSQSLKSLALVSPLLFKSNPFPLHNSASRKLGIGSHTEWDLAKTQRDKSLPEVDPVVMGRTSPIRNFYGKETISQHKPTVRFSATGTPLFEDQKWWQEPATIAGQLSTEAQARLSSSVTFSYQRRTMFPNGLPSFPDSTVSSSSRHGRRPHTSPTMDNNNNNNSNNNYNYSPTSNSLVGRPSTQGASISSTPFFHHRPVSPNPPMNFNIPDPLRQSTSSYMLARTKYYYTAK